MISVLEFTRETCPSTQSILLVTSGDAEDDPDGVFCDRNTADPQLVLQPLPHLGQHNDIFKPNYNPFSYSSLM